jgi:hypothetical protein
VILFESNGGQVNARASLAEIRLAVGEPDLEIAEIEPALERLVDTCYYLLVQGQKYSFSVIPNLNKLLADRRATISSLHIEERVHEEIESVFNVTRGVPAGVDRKFFPTNSTDIPNRPQLTLAVVAPELPYESAETGEVWKLVEKITTEHGESYRTFKNALIWCVADASNTSVLSNEARKLLALEAIESDEFADFDDTQRKQIAAAKDRAKRDLKEAVWRSYRHILLLDKNNKLRDTDLGLVHSSAADALVGYILRELRQAGEIVETIGVNYLLRNWPAQSEWSTKAVREVVFGSPKYPRLLNQDSLRTTFAQGVTNGQLAYVGKRNGGYEPFRYQEELRPTEIEFSDEMFLITKETAEAYLTAKSAVIETTQAEEKKTPEDFPINGSVINERGANFDLQQRTEPVQVLTEEANADEAGEGPVRKVAWRGEISALRWNTFYIKVLSPFTRNDGLKLTVQMDLAPEGGISRQKLEEIKMALRELGLSDELLEEK